MPPDWSANMLATNILDWYASLDGDIQITLTACATMTIMLSVGIIAFAWYRLRNKRLRADLVQQMLQRGMSSDEIVKVLFAAQVAEEAAKEGTTDEPEAMVVKHLTNNFYDGDDIERIIKAARGDGTIDETEIKIIKTMASNWKTAAEIVKVLEARGGTCCAPEPSPAGQKQPGCAPNC
jgi:hypothetical protein